MDIVGHTIILERFKRLIASNTLGHAYIFCGPQSVGKTTVARWLAGQLLKTERPETHPDFMRIQCEPNPKTGKMRERISIEQIQTMRARISHRAISGGYHVVMIERADLLSTSASNALLKTLEEPRGRVCFILTTPTDTALLPTVRSRAHTVRFHRVSRETICDALTTLGASREAAHTMAGFAAGRPGIALTLLRDPEALARLRNDSARVAACFSPRISERVLSVRDMIPAYRADHVETRAQLQERVALLEALARDQFLLSHGCTEIASDAQTSCALTPPQSTAALRAVRTISQRLSAHVDPHLALIDAMMHY